MIVKVGNQVFSSTTQPIAVRFPPEDRPHLKALAATETHDTLILGPEGTTPEELTDFVMGGAGDEKGAVVDAEFEEMPEGAE